MAEIRPFRAIRYDEEAARRLETVVAPPYDVISEDERREWLEWADSLRGSDQSSLFERLASRFTSNMATTPARFE